MKTGNRTDNLVKVFLVDDDALFLKSLEIDFKQNGKYHIETYESGEQCVNSLDHNPDIIILDYHLDGVNKYVMNGLETLGKINSFHIKIPVIMLSAQDKIEVAVECMHHGAYDYVVKSETSFLRIHKIIELMFENKRVKNELKWYMDRM